MFRPDPIELASLFPNCSTVKGEILTIDDTFFKSLLNEKYGIVNLLLRIVTPFYKFSKWKKFIFKSLPYMFKKYKVTCLVLKKDK